MDTVGELASRKKSQESNSLPTTLALSSTNANGTVVGQRRESRSWAGGSRIDDFFAAAMTKGRKG